MDLQYYTLVMVCFMVVNLTYFGLIINNTCGFYTRDQHAKHLHLSRSVARGGSGGLSTPFVHVHTNIVKQTFYCFVTLSLLLKLVVFIFKLKFTIADIMQHTDSYSVYSQLGS